MTAPPVIRALEGDSLLTKPDAMGDPSACGLSSSLTSSIRSSRSRITLAGDDAKAAAYHETKLDIMYDVTNNTRVFSWLDHLLAVFCIYRPGKIISTAPEAPTGPGDDGVHYNSPWVLPVYVLSNQRDAGQHQIPKEAKCTIDTGNMQGNLVSRAFIVDVLGYSESSFHKLTKVEKEGGTGITGHKLIPAGAIYLTWYHNTSTRVFHDMRFLVSEHPVCDLVIGARSIQKTSILDVPNLMVGNGRNIPNKEEDTQEKCWNDKKYEADNRVMSLNKAMLGKDIKRLKELEKEREEWSDVVEIAGLMAVICENTDPEGPNKDEIQKLEKILEKTPDIKLEYFEKLTLEDIRGMKPGWREKLKEKIALLSYPDIEDPEVKKTK